MARAASSTRRHSRIILSPARPVWRRCATSSSTSSSSAAPRWVACCTRGRGLLGGIEFVEDKASRVPFPRSAKFAERFADAALDTGITVWPNVGHADGTNGDAALIAPPFIITEPEIDEIVSRLTIALEKTISK